MSDTIHIHKKKNVIHIPKKANHVHVHTTNQ